MEKDDGNSWSVPALAGYRFVRSVGNGGYWKAGLMCGGVYEDELKDEADTVIGQQPITKAPGSSPKPAEDDGYYYPGSDPQE